MQTAWLRIWPTAEVLRSPPSTTMYALPPPPSHHSPVSQAPSFLPPSSPLTPLCNDFENWAPGLNAKCTPAG